MDTGAPADETQAALVVAVPEAAALVDPFRARFLPAALERRLPPHVTVLFPIVTTPGADREAQRAAALARRFSAFPARLERVGRFPGHVWLAPEPRHRFVRLLAATWRAFPEFPPYGLVELEPAPHLTVGAAGDGPELDAVHARAREELAPALPLAFHVAALSLLVEQADGTWAECARFRLRGG